MRTSLAVAAAFGTILSVRAVHAQAERAAVPRAPRPVALATGCSLSEPVCIHAVRGTPVTSELAARSLRAAEDASRALRALGLPRPVDDGSLGGSPDLDIYLDPRSGGGRAFDDAVSVSGAFDRASAFVVAGGVGPECALASNVARAMAQAMLLGLDPAAHESTLAMGSSEIAAQIAPCPALVSEAVDLFQRRPELALSRAPADRFAGAFLFPTYLEASYGHGVPGKLWTNLLAAGATRTVPGRYGWLAEPDVYDTLRRVFNGAGTSLDEALLGFAVARAFVGSRSDGAHLADVEQFGEFGRIRFDWALELASLPRRLALRPIEATGASYLWLDTAGASDNDRLTVVAECEVAQAMRFALVTVDARGQELGRHTAGRWGEATTQLTLEKLTGVAAVIVVAVAAGPDDRSHPFDPDDGPPSEVGCEVTFFRQ